MDKYGRLPSCLTARHAALEADQNVPDCGPHQTACTCPCLTCPVRSAQVSLGHVQCLSANVSVEVNRTCHAHCRPYKYACPSAMDYSISMLLCLMAPNPTVASHETIGDLLQCGAEEPKRPGKGFIRSCQPFTCLTVYTPAIHVLDGLYATTTFNKVCMTLPCGLTCSLQGRTVEKRGFARIAP